VSNGEKLGTLANMPQSEFSGTAAFEPPRLGTPVVSMTTASDHDDEKDPLERTELARRLRRMSWPPAPPEVKERILERIVAQCEEDVRADGDSPHQSGPRPN
jgi:hypothetical protein